MPSTHCRAVRAAPVSKCATCCSAWTPVSVRPAPCTTTRSFATRETASASTAWTLRCPRCACQPKNSLPSYSIPSAIFGIGDFTGALSAPAGSRSVTRERVDQALRLAPLPGIAFVEHLFENAARALRVAHVDVRPREVELRADLGHRMRIERAADGALLDRFVDADVE